MDSPHEKALKAKRPTAFHVSDSAKRLMDESDRKAASRNLPSGKPGTKVRYKKGHKYHPSDKKYN